MSKKSIVSRYVPKPRASVLTERVVDEIWREMQAGPLFDGEILDRIYGKNSPSRPANAYETVRQLHNRFSQKYGCGLLSTTAHRLEIYPGEKKQRRD